MKVYMFENTALAIFALNRPLGTDGIPLPRLGREWPESVCVQELVKRVCEAEFVGELLVITLH